MIIRQTNSNPGLRGVAGSLYAALYSQAEVDHAGSGDPTVHHKSAAACAAVVSFAAVHGLGQDASHRALSTAFSESDTSDSFAIGEAACSGLDTRSNVQSHPQFSLSQLADLEGRYREFEELRPVDGYGLASSMPASHVSLLLKMRAYAATCLSLPAGKAVASALAGYAGYLAMEPGVGVVACKKFGGDLERGADYVFTVCQAMNARTEDILDAATKPRH